jgi:hypothetical protein
MSSVARVSGYGGVRCCVKNLVTTLDLGQPIVVLGEGLKDIHGQRYRGGLCERICSHTTAHLNEIHGYKVHFWSFWSLWI